MCGACVLFCYLLFVMVAVLLAVLLSIASPLVAFIAHSNVFFNYLLYIPPTR